MTEVLVPRKFLSRPFYEVSEAARVLGLGSTLYWWLQGRTTTDRSYPPVLRSRVNKVKEVTWGEFIEAAMLRWLRREQHIPLQDLRRFRWSIQDEFPDTQYPLAEQTVYQQGRALSHALNELGLGDEATYEPKTKTVRYGEGVRLFLDRVDWQGAVPIRYRPTSAFPDVVIEPHRQFGAPHVEGMRTAAVYGLVQSGESIEWVARSWGRTSDLVQEAFEYEDALRHGRRLAA